jgi:hypothetical protein
MAQWDRAALSDVLDQRLTLEEMQDAAFDLGYEDAEGRAKSQLVRALLEYLDDRQQLDRLIDCSKSAAPTSTPRPSPLPLPLRLPLNPMVNPVLPLLLSPVALSVSPWLRRWPSSSPVGYGPY